MFKMIYTVKKLADFAGVSVRTLHYYDEVGILQPESRSTGGYRYYGEEAVVRLQQIMFFRELGFGLDEIKKILSSPDFDVIAALQSHQTLLMKKAERIVELLATVNKTIKKLKGKVKMQIQEYYKGFTDEQIEKYRQEVRQRWGEKTLHESEDRVIKMGKEKFSELQAEGGKIFQSISDNMSTGHDSDLVQAQVAEWRRWLENFHHYSNEAALGVGQAYSQHPEFAKFFQKYHKDLPEFLTKAIEYYFANKKQK
jgi:MerR family transcriptional regulator, thiopeptide resistance regulator